jgi:4-aminobutyrate aminotransferase-like enzyme
MGVGGVIIPPPEYLPQIREICSRNEVLLILDEVFAGFGRTGKMFAGEHFGVAPDIMAVAKALGGGFPLGAAICTQEVATAFEAGDHYTTYGWNNVIGLAAGIKTLEIMERENIADHAAEIGTYFLSELKMLQDRHAFIGDVRGKGLFIGVEIVEDRTSKIPDAKRAKKIKADLKAKGILVGITGNHACVVRITPPLNITKGNVDEFLDKFKETLDTL